MVAPQQLWFLRWWHGRGQGNDDLWHRCLLPALASVVILCGSFFPWLIDPLGEIYSAWRLPIDIGWQLRTGLVNYGVLCLGCGLYSLGVAYVHWRLHQDEGVRSALERTRHPAWYRYFVGKYRLAALLCFIPIVLFFLQYLCIDVRELVGLSQHKTQALLMQTHFGYGTTVPRIDLKAFSLQPETFWGRLALLASQISIGVILPGVSTSLLLIAHRWSLSHTSETFLPSSAGTSKPYRLRWWLIGVALLVVVLGRGPLAMLCNYQAKHTLAEGSYGSALQWLDAAYLLNPALDSTVAYHIERGTALASLQPNQHSDDARVYLASIYLDQADYLDAYQEMLPIWKGHRITPWMVEQMNNVLERSTEYVSPLRGLNQIRLKSDDAALPWVQTLTKVDPTNVYARYMAGRIQCDLHNYTGCTSQMLMVLQLSTDADVQSSAYTYLGLSAIGQGNYSNGRILLFKAQALDPHYHNNTAREELSGLH